MTAISPYQLFSLIVLFQFGTTVIFGFAQGAGRDAWIAALASVLIGTMMIVGYAVISKRNGDLSLVGWWRARLGKWIGSAIAWLYPLLFVYDASRGISDLKFLIPLTLLPETPPWFFTGAFTLLVVYVLYAGVEVLGRVAGILMPILILFIVLEILLLWASGSLHGGYLLPMLGEGAGRIAGNVWPLGITQTYGESLEIAVFWAMLNRKRQLIRISAGATLFAGLFIVLFDMLAIMALGEHVFMEMMFPAFSILKLSSVADFLENLDVFGALYFMCTIYIKVSMHLLAAHLCIRELIGGEKQSPHLTLWLVAGSAYVAALLLENNFNAHIQFGSKVLPSLIWVPMFIVLPGAMLVISLLAKPLGRKPAA